MYNNGELMGPETINSVMMLLCDELENTNLVNEAKKRPGIPATQKRVSSLLLYRLLEEKKDLVEPFEIKDFFSSKDEYERWQTFSKYTHCLGNFVLTKKRYNTNQVDGINTLDFWDVKLKLRYKEKATEDEYIEYINTFFFGIM